MLVHMYSECPLAPRVQRRCIVLLICNCMFPRALCTCIPLRDRDGSMVQTSESVGATVDSGWFIAAQMNKEEFGYLA